MRKGKKNSRKKREKSERKANSESVLFSKPDNIVFSFFYLSLYLSFSLLICTISQAELNKKPEPGKTETVIQLKKIGSNNKNAFQTFQTLEKKRLQKSNFKTSQKV